MNRPFLLISAALIKATLPAQSDIEVHFASGSTTVNPAGCAAIQVLCGAAVDGSSVTVIGHSDGLGTTARNDALSIQRANAVAEHIEALCPKLKVHAILGRGGSDPIASDRTEAGRMANRRVDVIVESASMLASSPLLDPITSNCHARVEPLMPAVDKPRELHRVDASKAMEVRMSDGTIVRIPEASLLHADGTVVEGTIDLTYRGFLDPWDVVASGIPMHLGSGSEAGHFETAGMYEVYASQYGEQVYLRSGVEIELETTGPDVSDEYAAYALNETSGEWERAGRFMAPPMTTLTGPSAAVRRYNELLRGLPSLPDSTRFKERQDSPDYCYMTPCTKARRPYLYNDGAYRSPYTRKDIPAVKLVLDRRYWKAHKRLAFSVNGGHRTHPEMHAFKGRTRWIYTGPMDARTFRRQVIRKHYYQDMELLGDRSDRGTLRLKDRGTWSELPVELIDPREEESTEWAEVAFARYQDRLLKKQQRFDQDIERDLRRTRSTRERLFRNAYAKASREMTTSEQAMDRDAFDMYAMTTAVTSMVTQQRDNSYLYSRRPRFAMPGFGIWNCDRMVPLPTIDVPVEVIAANGEPLRWVKAFGVPGKGRAVITYWSQGETTVQDMRLSNECERIIFLDGERNMIVADVSAGKRTKGSSLRLQGRPLDQPQDRNVLATLALMD